MTKISCVYCPLKESIRNIFVIQCPGQKRFGAQFGSRFWGGRGCKFFWGPQKDAWKRLGCSRSRVNPRSAK